MRSNAASSSARGTSPEECLLLSSVAFIPVNKHPQIHQRSCLSYTLWEIDIHNLKYLACFEALSSYCLTGLWNFMKVFGRTLRNEMFNTT